MKLVVTEKNIAAKKLAEILAVGKPTADKIYSTPVYRFRRDGEDWISIGLKGHIMGVDFPEEYSKWRLDPPMGVADLVNAPLAYNPAEKGIIQSLRNLAKKADHVTIATDFDREGELIGADARGVVLDANPNVPVDRVRYSAITREEIERAFDEIGPLDDNLAAAAATRRDVDLIWGAVLTRYLTLTSNKASKRAWGDVLSAGRVQTPTLKLIVDREREREAFEPEDFWVVKARFRADAGADAEFGGTHEAERFSSAEDALRVIEAVRDKDTATIVSLTTNRRTVKPPAPFNTTSLMAAASAEGLSPARTMRIAESLYMDGLISYPRVDNTVYPPSLDLRALLKTLDAVPAYHETVSKLLGKGTLTATRGAKETTDHPPIHPTGAADPERLKPEEYKLYNLVARRFLATLSDPAVLESSKAVLEVGGERFVARGDIVIVPGFRGVYHYGLKKEEQLPVLEEGKTCTFLGAETEAKQTQPPSRYSQGRLIQEMEKRGLGTKATRHDIIQTLYDRKYIVNDPTEPTAKGRSVIDALSMHAERITTPDMTSELDREMDDIANARNSREKVVAHSRQLLADMIDVLIESVPDVGEALKVAADEDAKVGKCPVSGHDLLIKYSPKTKSYFVGCSGYPECEVTYPLPKNAKFSATDEMCPVCGSPQVTVRQFKRPVRVMCLAPDCPTKKGPEIEIGRCAECGGALMVKYSQVGSRYVRCENYDAKEHPVSYPLPQSGELEATGEVCDPCGAPRVIVHTKKGPWKICISPECPNRTDKAAGGARGRNGKAAGRTSAAAAKRKPAAKKKTGTKRTGSSAKKKADE